MSTAHNMFEAFYASSPPKDDNLTDRYEFNWCLRSPLGGRLLMHRGSQYHSDALETRCEEHASSNSKGDQTKNGPFICNTAPNMQLV